VADGSVDRVVVQRSERKAEDLGLLIELADEVGATDAAEAPVGTRRRLVVANEVFTRGPPELRCLHLAACPERGTVRLAAHRAMAIEQIDDGAIDLEGDPFAETTSVKHATFLRVEAA
jgi:hypothetical protein